MNHQQIQRQNALTNLVWQNFDDFENLDTTMTVVSGASSIKYQDTKRRHAFYIASRLILPRRNISEIANERRNVRSQNLKIYYEYSEWGKPCKNMFRFLASNEPDRLIDIIKHGDLRETLLTFALEELGKVQETSLIMNLLFSFLRHDDSLVREGAVYGLSSYAARPEAQDIFHSILVNDPSRGVREAIEEILEDI